MPTDRRIYDTDNFRDLLDLLTWMDSPLATELAITVEERAEASRLQALRARRGRETQRDSSARANEALAATVRATRDAHPGWGRRKVAREILHKNGNEVTSKGIEALAARILRLDHPTRK